jgi:hypothetical protein
VESEREQRMGRYAQPDSPRPASVGGLGQALYSRSLGVVMFLLFAVFLRQRGSPESKPVGAPHSSTGVEG